MVFLIPHIEFTDLYIKTTLTIRFKAPNLGITPRRCP